MSLDPDHQRILDLTLLLGLPVPQRGEDMFDVCVRLNNGLTARGLAPIPMGLVNWEPIADAYIERLTNETTNKPSSDRPD